MLKHYALLGRSYAMLYLLTKQDHYLIKALVCYKACQEIQLRQNFTEETTVVMAA